MFCCSVSPMGSTTPQQVAQAYYTRTLYSYTHIIKPRRLTAGVEAMISETLSNQAHGWSTDRGGDVRRLLFQTRMAHFLVDVLMSRTV
jgi:hypothetical protein